MQAPFCGRRMEYDAVALCRPREYVRQTHAPYCTRGLHTTTAAEQFVFLVS